MDYTQLGIDQLQKAIENGEITSKELVIAYMKKIAAIDSCEGGLNSVVEINPDAIFIAEELDKERADGKVRGSMHGIPVMLKDNINTGDKMHTTAGSLALKDNYAPCDAGVVANLRKSGAIILAKTNLTEFANFMTNGIPNGYSSRGGQVLCSLNRTKDPSGSSTGSAVAVSAKLTSVGIGTETSGSILSPSLTNGIVGMKPTKGLIPSDGIIPISYTLDTSGPMGRCVKDVAILLGAMTGYKYEYAKRLRSTSLEGLKIGVNRAHMNIMEEEDIVSSEKLLVVLKKAGAILVEDINMPFHKELKDILENEFKNNMNHYLSTLNPSFKIKTLEDIIEYNKRNKEKALKYGQKHLLQANYFTSGRMVEPEYLEAMAVREKTIQELDDVMDTHKLDIMLHFAIFNNLAPFAGFPSITIPTELKEDGMPTGTHLMARRNDETTLLKVAYAIENVLGFKLF